MPLKTWVARFVVDNGKVTEEGGRLRTFQRRRLDENEVDLHLIAEPAGAKGEELGAQSLDAIGRAFMQDRLSLTGGIVRALKSTHQTLLDWNRRSVPREQASVGIGAAVVSGTVVYLAQCGPGIAFLRRDERLTRFEPEDEALSPLGEGECEPAVRRVELEPGDLLLVASPAIDTILDSAHLNALLGRGGDEALPELYLLTRDLPNFALFAATCMESDDEPVAPDELDEGPSPSLRMPDGDDVGDIGLPDRPDRFEGVDEDERTMLSLGLTTAGESRSTSATATLAPPVNNGPPPLDISKSVVRLRSDQSIGRSAYAHTTGAPPRLRIDLTDRRIRWAGGLLVLALLVFAFVPGLMKEGRSEKLGDLVGGAQTQLSTALAANDPAERRRLLEDTRRLATEALRLDSNNTAAAELRQQAANSLGAMDAVFDLGPMTSVSVLSRQLTGDLSLEGLTIAGSNAYLLDTKGGRVISVPVDGSGSPQVVFQDGETYGGTPAKKPMYFTWEGSDRAGRLLVLDAERKLFELRPGATPAPLPLRRTNTWASVAGLAAYDGNLYVLDPKGNQVHRYLPAAAGFDSEPGSALTGQQGLADAQGLVVDGDIYVFFKDGRVRRFRSGNDAGFGFGGIDRQPRAATDLAIVRNAEEVYLADSGNKRIVVATRDGTFKRQFVSNALTDLRALALDPSGAQLFVVVGDSLLSAPVIR